MLADTSIIIELLTRQRNDPTIALIREQLRNEEISISILELAEISDWCIQNGSPREQRIQAVKKFSNIIAVDEQVCLDGSEIKQERRKQGYRDFGIIDGMILASARRVEEKLLTFDPHFEGIKDCIVLRSTRRS